MSRYELNRLLFDLKMQDALVAEMRADPDAVLARYDLTAEARALPVAWAARSDLAAEERAALATRDPRQLRPLGAHGMLALYALRLRPEYDDNAYWTQK